MLNKSWEYTWNFPCPGSRMLVVKSHWEASHDYQVPIISKHIPGSAPLLLHPHISHLKRITIVPIFWAVKWGREVIPCLECLISKFITKLCFSRIKTFRWRIYFNPGTQIPEITLKIKNWTSNRNWCMAASSPIVGSSICQHKVLLGLNQNYDIFCCTRIDNLYSFFQSSSSGVFNRCFLWYSHFSL